MTEARIKPITQAIKDIAQGKMIILVDDDDRENEGDFVFAAENKKQSSFLHEQVIFFK